MDIAESKVLYILSNKLDPSNEIVIRSIGVNTDQCVLWNIKTNTFMCNHVHTTEDLVNYLQKEKVISDSLCPMCNSLQLHKLLSLDKKGKPLFSVFNIIFTQWDKGGMESLPVRVNTALHPKYHKTNNYDKISLIARVMSKDASNLLDTIIDLRSEGHDISLEEEELKKEYLLSPITTSIELLLVKDRGYAYMHNFRISSENKYLVYYTISKAEEHLILRPQQSIYNEAIHNMVITVPRKFFSLFVTCGFSVITTLSNKRIIMKKQLMDINEYFDRVKDYPPDGFGFWQYYKYVHINGTNDEIDNDETEDEEVSSDTRSFSKVVSDSIAKPSKDEWEKERNNSLVSKIIVSGFPYNIPLDQKGAEMLISRLPIPDNHTKSRVLGDLISYVKFVNGEANGNDKRIIFYNNHSYENNNKKKKESPLYLLVLSKEVSVAPQMIKYHIDILHGGESYISKVLLSIVQHIILSTLIISSDTNITISVNDKGTKLIQQPFDFVTGSRL